MPDAASTSTTGTPTVLTGMTCIKVYDLDSGEPRPSTAADLATITRVADALPHIDGVCIACKDVQHSDIHGEIAEFAIMAENTTKPLEYLCEHARIARRGDRDGERDPRRPRGARGQAGIFCKSSLRCR